MAEEYRKAGLPAPWARRLAGAETADSQGDADRITTSVLDLTDREPRTVRAFVREHAGEWATSTTGRPASADRL